MEELPETGNTEIEVLLRNRDREALDLSGGGYATLRWRIGSQARNESTMQVSTTETGVVTYRFGDGELVPGILAADVHATDGNGYNYFTRRPMYIRIRRVT